MRQGVGQDNIVEMGHGVHQEGIVEMGHGFGQDETTEQVVSQDRLGYARTDQLKWNQGYVMTAWLKWDKR